MKKTIVAISLLSLGTAALLIMDGCQGGVRPSYHSSRHFERLTERHLDYLLDKIDATEAQRPQIRIAIEQLAEGLKPLHVDHEQVYQTVRQQWEMDRLDAERLHALIDEQVEQMRSLGYRVADDMVAFHGVLTPQQRQQLTEEMKQHRGHKGGRR